MLSFSSSGSTSKTDDFLRKMQQGDFTSGLDALGARGVAALQAATPTDSGATAAAWGYEVKRSSTNTTITWTNSNIVKGINIAVILQYGHGTGTGGYVAGRDYINPAIQPIFDQIQDDMWKQVTSA